MNARSQLTMTRMSRGSVRATVAASSILVIAFHTLSD